MDRELRRFLHAIQTNGIVVDIGGGWGWHWRGLEAERPDVSVVVVDFVRENLRKAAGLLGSLVNRKLFLVHGDATALPFPSSAFDGYWSVQTLQHVPDAEPAISEARRVLRGGGQFASYSLNRQRLIELAYRVCGRSYHVRGKRPDSFWLSRGSEQEARIVARVFGASVTSRYTEVLFHPDLRLCTGAESSRIGRVDACLSSATPTFAWVARQRSYHTRKPVGTDQSG
jgi:ubiquinone/menaquinone biosynthesis C-methylase UbiE